MFMILIELQVESQAWLRRTKTSTPTTDESARLEEMDQAGHAEGRWRVSFKAIPRNPEKQQHKRCLAACMEFESVSHWSEQLARYLPNNNQKRHRGVSHRPSASGASSIQMTESGAFPTFEGFTVFDYDTNLAGYGGDSTPKSVLRQPL